MIELIHHQRVGRNQSWVHSMGAWMIVAAMTFIALLPTSAQASENIALPTEAQWKALPPHPRLFANDAQFAAANVRNDQTGLPGQQLRTLLLREADSHLAAAPLVYPKTGLLIFKAREAQQRIFALAMAYRLTGDKRYANRAREELLALTSLPQWPASHFLGVCEATLAAGVGYDWLYDELSASEREQVRAAIVRNALQPSLTIASGGDSWVDGNFNWTQVCHASLTTAAIAIAEDEPALARAIVNRALGNMGNVGASYAPDGAYAEGPSYWLYGTSFHVLLIEALRSSFGNAFGMDRFPGFLNTADYKNQVRGPTGEEFNYSDYHVESTTEPVLLWFAREVRDLDVAEREVDNINNLYSLTSRDARQPEMTLHRHAPFALLWSDKTLVRVGKARTRHWTAGGTTPLAVMRSAWGDRNATFVAMKGGSPHHSHGHMDVGSFVLEANGVRWALDLGVESYDKMRAAKLQLWNYDQDSTRWQTFRIGAEAHNILRFDNRAQLVTGRAEVTRAADTRAGSTSSMGNTILLTPLYREQVERVERTIRLHPDRTVSIEDTWTTGARAVKAQWQWLTRATVTIGAAGIMLTQDGKTLQLVPTRNGKPVPLTDMAVEDVSAPRALQDSANPGVSRIVITSATEPNRTATLTVLASSK
jgi:oligo-alginate lyase